MTRTHVLRAGGVRVSVAPEHGCVIHRIDTGRGNLLWHDGREPQRLRGSRLTGDASAAEFDDDVLIGGWFPMFPNAGLPTADTQQHGWAPRVAWTVRERAEARLVAEVSGPFLEGGTADVTRDIEVCGGGLTVRSTVTNAGRTAGSFTWGEHPCFSRDSFAGGRAFLSAEDVAVLPEHMTSDAGHLARSVSGGVGGLASARGSVTLTDLSGTLGHWLAWWNYAAADLPRADTFAWEPSTAPGMGLADAIRAGAVETLEPGESFTAEIRCEWTLSTIAISPPTME